MLKSVWWWVGARTVGSVGRCKLGHMNVSLSLKLECCGTRAEAAEAAAARLSAMPLRARLGLWAGFAACRCAPTYLGRRAGSCRRPWQKQPARTPSARTAVGQTERTAVGQIERVLESTASCPAKEHKYTDQQARPAPTHGNLPLSLTPRACLHCGLAVLHAAPARHRAAHGDVDRAGGLGQLAARLLGGRADVGEGQHRDDGRHRHDGEHAKALGCRGGQQGKVSGAARYALGMPGKEGAGQPWHSCLRRPP